jgi:DNA-binding GntR family transcriptional regulator
MNIRMAENLTRQVYCQIRDQILRGSFDGQHLSESFFATTLGVSKSPIREALNRLETEGLIVIRPRRGAWVPRFSAEDAREICELCEVLDSAALRRLVVDRECIDRLRASIRVAEDGLYRKDKRDYFAAEVDFHRAIASWSANARLSGMLNSLHQQMLILFQQTTAPPDDRWIAEHREVLAALERARFTESAILMAKHICSVREFLIKALEIPAAASSSV